MQNKSFGQKILINSLIMIAILLVGLVVIKKESRKSSATLSFSSSDQNKSNSTTITYFISDQPAEKFCNGVDMDSDGYKKTITHKMTKIITTPINEEERIKETLLAASETANHATLVHANKNFISLKNGTASISPFDGWAGVSIFMCAWKPIVEVNLSQFKEINKIAWPN